MPLSISVLYRPLITVYRKLPAPVRRCAEEVSVLRALRRQVGRFLQKDLSGEDLYDRDYFLDFAATREHDASTIVNTLCRLYSPASVIDVGCGGGQFLQEFASQGVKARGFDGSTASVALCNERGCEAELLDLAGETLPDTPRPDLTMCLEVVEHLPEKAAANCVAILAHVSNTLVLSAAHPGQGGIGHLNEQPPEYWIEKFVPYGFCLDEADTELCRQEWKAAKVATWYWHNTIVLKRAPSTSDCGVTE